MLNDTTETSTTPVAADPAPAPEPAKVEAAPAEIESAGDKAAREDQELDDDLRKAFRKANQGERERDETGKFKSREEQPAPTLDKDAKEDKPAKPVEAKEAKPDEKAVEKPAEVKPKIAPPQAWKADAKAKWETLPPDVQQIVADREAEAHKTISQLGEKAKVIDDLRQVFEPHMGRVPRDIGPVGYVNNLLAADAALARDPVEFIKTVAGHYKVDLNSLVADPYAYSDPQQAQWESKFAASQARVEELERRLGEVGHRVIGREQAEREAQAKQYDDIVEKFAADKPEWAQVLPEVSALVPALMQANPTATPQELLQQAYDRAVWGNPETRKGVLERQQKEAERKRLESAKEAAAKAKRAGSINVRGTPMQNGNASLDDDLRSVWRRINAA